MLSNQNIFAKDFSKKGIFFYYDGPISQNTVRDIVSILKQKLNLEHASGTIIRQVFPMVVENAQNIMHYSAETLTDDSGKELRAGKIMVGCKENYYFVWCGNIIENNRVYNLSRKLTALRNMTKDELMQYYMEQARKKRDDNSKGAGLGFLEIARNASKPVEFDFEKIDKNTSFFTLKTFVQR